MLSDSLFERGGETTEGLFAAELDGLLEVKLEGDWG